MDATYVSSSSFIVSGDRTDEFITDRRVKLDCVADGIKYAIVVASSYSSPNTTVSIDESTLTSNLATALYGIVQPGEYGSLPDHSHDGSEGSGGYITASGGGGASTLLELTDTPSAYDDGKFLKSTAVGTEWTTVTGAGGGTSDHSALNELDYASAGHTGFSPTSHTHTESNITDLDKYTQAEVDALTWTESDITDLDKYTQAEVDTISGSLSSEIDSDISTHSASADHDGRYYTESEVDALTWTESDITDLDKYTQAEVDTISGSLQTNIDAKPDTLLELTDTPAGYDDGKYLKSTTSGTEWATVSGGTGTSNHSELNELDYASSGHTGFSSTSHTHTEANITDLDKYTQAEVDTISGSLSAEIDSDVSTHATSADHDGRYYTESEVDALTWTESDITDLDKYTQSEVDTISGSLSAEINSDISTHASSADHDGRYYTESEVDALTWTESDITDLDKYTQAEVDALITTVSGQLDDHNELNNLDYASSGHTGFAPTSHTHTEVNITDLDKYTQSEVDTISGSLSSEIDADITTHATSADHDGRYYTESEVDALTWTESDITDLDKYTQAEVNTISGSLSTEIDSDISTHATSADHDGRYYTESEVDALTWTESDITDLDKYTQAEVNTISGSLQTNIDAKPDTLLELTDTPAGYDDGKYLKSTTSGTEWATVSGGEGTSNHSELNELDYASAGHTGFAQSSHTHIESDITDLGDYATTADLTTASGYLQTQIDGKSDTGHTHVEANITDLDKYTQAEVDTISGSLGAEIDSDISTHATSADHDGRYYTESEVDALTWTESDITDLDKYTQAEINTISGSLQTNIDAKPDTFLDLPDTPVAYSTGKLLQTTADGIEFVNASTVTSNVYARYVMSAGDTIADATNVRLDFETKEVDTHNAVTTGASWVFTVPEAGYYGCYVKTLWDSASWESGNYQTNLQITLGGTKSSDYFVPNDGGYVTCQGFYVNYCNQGATIYARIYQNTGAPHTLRSSSSNIHNFITIFKLDATVVSGTLVDLTDTPAAYDDGKVLMSTADGTEWATVSSEGGVTTLSGLTDTPNVYDDGKYLRSTASGTEWAVTGGGSIGTSSDNTMARYDGTDAIQGTGITIDDLNNVTGVDVLTLSGSLNISSDNALRFPVDNTNIAIGPQAGNALTTGASSNVVIGNAATFYNETGDYNVAVGYLAGNGASGQSYSHDVFIGYRAGFSTTDGGNNVSIGSYSGYYNQTGDYNVTIGQEAGYGTISTSHNNSIIIGYRAGYSISTGGNNVAIGHTALYYNKTGSQNVAMGYQAGYGQSGNSNINNVFIGYQSGYAITTGAQNINLGTQAGYRNETGASNVVIGYQAGYGTTANSYSGNVFIGYNTARTITTAANNTFVGYYSGYSITTGASNVYMGHSSGLYNQTGGFNVVIGREAGNGVEANSFSNNTFVGYRAAYSTTTGGANVSIGYQASFSSTTGANNVVIGYYASRYNETGYDNVVIGREAGHGASSQNYIHSTMLGYRAGYSNTTGGYNFYGGSQAGYFNQTGQYNTIIGESAGYGSSGNSYSNNTFVGNSAGNANTTGGDSVLMGYRAAYYNQTGQYNVVMGSWAGYGVTANSYSNNVIMGYQAAYAITTGGNNVIMGYQAARYSLVGGNNVVLGYQAGSGATSQTYTNNTLVGYQSGYSVSTGGSNTFVGYYSGRYNTTGTNNVGVGFETGLYNQTGASNICIGYQAGRGVSGQSYISNIFIGQTSGFSITTGGSNVCLGYGSGYSLTTGASNLFLGSNSGYFETGSNKLYIDNSSTTTPLIYGEFDNDFLRVNGDLDVTGNLTVSGTGVASTLLDLTDTPDTYGTTSSGSAGNYLMATSSGIEYREFYYYGTGDPPTASGVADGVLYFKYTV